MKIIYVLFMLLFLMACSSTKYISTPIERYIDYLNKTDIKKEDIYYGDVVIKLGEPVTKNEHENDFVATWQETYLRKARVADELGGRKIIIFFNKKTKNIINWKYKTW